MYKWTVQLHYKCKMHRTTVTAQSVEYDTQYEGRPSWVFYDADDKFVADFEAEYVVSVIRGKKVKG